MSEEGPGWSLGYLLTRLEEDESSKKIQEECPKGGKPGDTMFQKTVETLYQKKQLIKSVRCC